MTAYEQQYDVYLKEIQAALENACNTICRKIPGYVRQHDTA